MESLRNPDYYREQWWMPIFQTAIAALICLVCSVVYLIRNNWFGIGLIFSGLFRKRRK